MTRDWRIGTFNPKWSGLRWVSLTSAAPVLAAAREDARCAGRSVDTPDRGVAPSVVLPSSRRAATHEIGCGSCRRAEPGKRGFGSPASSPARVPGRAVYGGATLGGRRTNRVVAALNLTGLDKGALGTGDPVIGHARLTGGARLIRAVGVEPCSGRFPATGPR